jgi:hypothetical protein
MYVQLHHCRLTNKSPPKVVESTIFPKPDEVDDNAKEKGVCLDVNDKKLECGTVMSELRILKSDHILSKVLV